MANELQITKDSVTYQPAKVDFVDYEQVKASAERLAKRVAEVQVTPDNVKESKKLRAAVNKQVDQLDRYRIDLKKAVLKDYTVFEKQVKEIKSIVGEANATVDAQVKELDEQERQAKEKQIAELFDQHVQAYEGFPLSVSDFLAQHGEVLNKSVSLNKAEEIIAQWLMKTQSDISAIRSQQNADEVLAEYTGNGGDLGQAISLTAQRFQAREDAQKVLAESHLNNEVVQHRTIFTLTDPKDVLAVEMFMKNNNITYTKVEE